MAKVKAPLFSFSAAGKLADSLVYFPWKGIPVVRQYVIPANPNTTGQSTQRGYLHDAVAAIHAAQVLVANPLNAVDIAAYNLLGTIYATPRTWFNTVCKQWLDQKVASLEASVIHGATVTPGDGTLTVVLYDADFTTGKIETGTAYYGTSKTALINSLAATPDLTNHTMTISLTALANGTKYFVQFKTATVALYVGVNSGIFSGTPAV